MMAKDKSELLEQLQKISAQQKKTEKTLSKFVSEAERIRREASALIARELFDLLKAFAGMFSEGTVLEQYQAIKDKLAELAALDSEYIKNLSAGRVDPYGLGDGADRSFFVYLVDGLRADKDLLAFLEPVVRKRGAEGNPFREVEGVTDAETK
jgi:hypothetical protein